MRRELNANHFVRIAFKASRKSSEAIMTTAYAVTGFFSFVFGVK